MKFWALLFLTVNLAVLAGFWAGNATSQEVLPEQSPLVTACDLAINVAAQDRLNVEKCRRVAEVTQGHTALVTVRVKVSGMGWYTFATTLYDSKWSVQTFRVLPE